MMTQQRQHFSSLHTSNFNPFIMATQNNPFNRTLAQNTRTRTQTFIAQPNFISTWVEQLKAVGTSWYQKVLASHLGLFREACVCIEAQLFVMGMNFRLSSPHGALQQLIQTKVLSKSKLVRVRGQQHKSGPCRLRLSQAAVRAK